MSLRSNDASLCVDRVSVYYGRGASPAVQDISFTAASGSRFVLMGRSGCGKSTLLKAVGGFLAYQGKIEVAGQAVREPGPDRMVVWQDHEQLLPWKTVCKNVSYPLELRGVLSAEARDRAEYWLNKVGLQRALNYYPHELSGGMKMRAAIARALASGPRLLLMDEPFSALDAHTREVVQDLLLALQEEVRLTLLFVTHDIREAIRIGNRILVLSDHPGRVIRELTDISSGLAGRLEEEIKTLIFLDEGRE